MLQDLIFPRKCVGCKKTGAYFCSQCLNFVSLEPKTICPICQKPSRNSLPHPGCKTKYGLDGLTSVFANKGIIKKAIKKLKYQFISDLSEDLVELILSFCGEDKYFSQFCQQKQVSLVPIPLDASKKRWQGFNQNEVLGKIIAQNLNIKFSSQALKKRKNTFQVSPSSLTPKILLFNDLWEKEIFKKATKVLKENKVKKVWGLTLVR
jgi:predicted amidophosphoribosyltransferase